MTTLPEKASSVKTIPFTHRERLHLDLNELTDIVMQLRCGVDRVIWLIGDTGGYMVITREDLAVVEDFIADRTDTLALPGGMLDVPEGWAE